MSHPGEGERPRLELVKPQSAQLDEVDGVIDGVVVDDTGWTWATRLPAVRTAVTVVRHERTQAVARHLVYPVIGVRVAGGRLWRARPAAKFDRRIGQAIAAGDHATAQEWERLNQSRRKASGDRLEFWVLLPGRMMNALPGVLFGSAVVLGLIGGLLAYASGDKEQVSAPVRAVGKMVQGFAELAQLIAIVVTVAWGPLVLASPYLVAAGLYSLGRRHAEDSGWAWVAAPALRGQAEGEPITPSLVVVAMRDLGIPALRKAVKEMGDAGAGMLSPIRIAGCGDEVDVKLPSGVSTEEILGRRRKLAENLGRHEHELHITIPAPRTVRLWIAMSGALDEPIGPSPLVTDPTLTTSYKSGRAPWGQDLRGDAYRISLYQRHLLITGISNQGKTASLRSLALWLALDPTVEFRIADLKGRGKNGKSDWAMFEGIATVLITGPTDEHAIAATHMVEEAVAEMERRLLAPPGAQFRPLVVIVDEAQVAYTCPAKDEAGNPYGGQKATSRYFMAVRRLKAQGRVVDDVLWEGTQDPTDENLPKLTREASHIRAALVLGTESQAAMALGETPVKAGAAPHKLRQGLDKGTLVLAGDVGLVAGQASITVRTHFIGDDDAERVADRARALRGPVDTAAQSGPGEVRDLLDDVNEVMETERARLSDLPGLLRQLAPGYAPYEGLNGIGLDARLKALGVRTINPGNVLQLDRKHLRDAIATRLLEGE